MIAGLPRSVAGTTVNRWCGSSMQAVHVAAGAIALGSGNAFIAAGVEHDPRADDGLQPDAQSGARRTGTGRLHADGHHRREPAAQYGISRAEQEDYAVLSPEGRRGAVRRRSPTRSSPSKRLTGAGGGGRLHPPGSHRRKAGDPEARLQLCGSVTAGTSSPLTDGAAAVLVVSEEFARPMA